MSDTINKNNTPNAGDVPNPATDTSTFVEIPVTIRSDVSTAGRTKEEIQNLQIENARFYISAITYFIRMTARQYSALDLATGTEIVDPKDFLFNTEQCCFLIDGLLEAIELPALGLYMDSKRKSLVIDELKNSQTEVPSL